MLTPPIRRKNLVNFSEAVERMGLIFFLYHRQG